MALFDKEKRRQKREAKELERAQAKYQEDLVSWQAHLAKAEEYLEAARGFEGVPASEADVALVAKKGELVFLHMPGAGLIEPRRLPGQWKGSHSGFNVRIAKGVSYRVGGSRGTYQQGAESQQLVDEGDVIVSNMRVVFLGSKKTREWAYSRLLGIQHDDEVGATYMQVSNRQKVSGIGYGLAVAADVQFRLGLALAHFGGSVDEFTSGLSADVAKLRSERPIEPLPPPSVA